MNKERGNQLPLSYLDKTMYYNIYYQNSKVNKKPLTKEDVNYIKTQKFIYKRNEVKDTVEEINTNQIRIISCEII